jgi:hypothetical protein
MNGPGDETIRGIRQKITTKIKRSKGLKKLHVRGETKEAKGVKNEPTDLQLPFFINQEAGVRELFLHLL